MTPQPDPKLIEFVEQQDIQREFRDPISHLWTVVHESSIDEDASVGRSAIFVEPGARQRVIEHGPGWPHGYDNGLLSSRAGARKTAYGSTSRRATTRVYTRWWSRRASTG